MRKQRGLLLTTKDTKGVAFYAPRHAVPKKKNLFGGAVLYVVMILHMGLVLILYLVTVESRVHTPLPRTNYQNQDCGKRNQILRLN